MKSHLFLLALGIACFAALGQAMEEENWPAFRGSKTLGVSDNPNLPLEWTDKKNVEWRTAVPGLGWSNPVVHSGRIYLTSAVSDGEIEPRKPGLYYGGDLSLIHI